MKRASPRRNRENTVINLYKLHQFDPTMLYSDADLSLINRWNEECQSGSRDEPLLPTSESLWYQRTTASQTLEWCPLQIYCLVLNDIGWRRNTENTSTKIYSITELCELHPEMRDPKTVRKYVGYLIKAGLLEKTRIPGYYQRAERGDLGPVFETLAAEGDDADIVFENFPSEQQQFGSTVGLPQLPSWKTIKHYFWNEHIAGAALVMVATVPTIQLLNRVSQNGTVSTLDIGIAFLLTWIWLIGILALVIGLLRRGFPNFLRRD